MFVQSKAHTFSRIVNSRPEVTVFTRQLATLLDAGVPLLRALETLTRQQTQRGFKSILERIADYIRSGNRLSDGLAEFPRVFDRLYLNMIRAGEASGALEKVLGRVALFREKSDRLRKRVKSALIYPVIVISVAVVIVALLMLFVVPKFQAIYQTMPQLKHVALPLITRLVIQTGQFVQHHFILVGALLATVAAGLGQLKRTRWGGSKLDALLHQIPLLGGLLQSVTIARIARTLGTLISSGVPLLDAIRITSSISNNAVFSHALDIAHDRVRDGEALSAPLESARIFPPMVVSMIQVGEETGRLPAMLEKIADAYEEDVDNAVTGLTAIIEPVMIVLLAFVVGTIVIALFLPIISIIEHLGGR